MNEDWTGVGIAPADILLPSDGVYLPAWAVVACDQYTSQPEYWLSADARVTDKPSTLRIVLPEIHLKQAEERIPVINKTMHDYLNQGVLRTAVQGGFVLTERSTTSGDRIGLVVKVDLECYDYTPGSSSLIRATEGTILSRIPPRVAIRKDAPIETSHVMLLMDDVMHSVVEPIHAARKDLPMLYDFPLMMKGGHLRGWAVTDSEHLSMIYNALAVLKQRSEPLFCVGDGNHSLATAKTIWDETKKTLSPSEQEVHPARYALVEIENIHDDALSFEPIHRLVKGVNPHALMQDWTIYCHDHGMDLSEAPSAPVEHSFRVVYSGTEADAVVSPPDGALPVGTLQNYLDDFLKRHAQAEIDYIHGEDALRTLCQEPNTIGFIVPGIDKSTLFPAVARDGALPRKTFSMGEAHEKRYYMECRKIV